MLRQSPIDYTLYLRELSQVDLLSSLSADLKILLPENDQFDRGDSRGDVPVEIIVSDLRVFSVRKRDSKPLTLAACCLIAGMITLSGTRAGRPHYSPRSSLGPSLHHDLASPERTLHLICLVPPSSSGLLFSVVMTVADYSLGA